MICMIEMKCQEHMYIYMKINNSQQTSLYTKKTQQNITHLSHRHWTHHERQSYNHYSNTLVDTMLVFTLSDQLSNKHYYAQNAQTPDIKKWKAQFLSFSLPPLSLSLCKILFTSILFITQSSKTYTGWKIRKPRNLLSYHWNDYNGLCLELKGGVAPLGL